MGGSADPAPVLGGDSMLLPARVLPDGALAEAVEGGGKGSTEGGGGSDEAPDDDVVLSME